jgi:GntR family transcriptional regulator
MNEKPAEAHIPLHISMDNPEPMYAQIESQLKDFILADILTPGTRLPSIRALASQLSCSVITTRRVYEDLEREGFVLTRSGRGTVVARIPEEKMAALLREPVERALREAIGAARRAGLTGEDLHHLLREMMQTEEVKVHQGGTS